MPWRTLIAAFFCLAKFGAGQPPPQWHVVTEPALRLGQIGALGGERPPSNWASLKSYEALALLRAHGAATFATSNHGALPLDLGAARLIDGLVVDSDASLALWSFLLDHGYSVAPIAGAAGRLYVNCPEPTCVADAIREQRTLVSTGPTLTAIRHGQQLEVEAWGDGPLRVELWAHNRVLASQEAAAGSPVRLDWTPTGAADWVAVRVFAKNGWAITSAFLAEPWPTPTPLTTHLKMVFPEVASHQQGMLATVWHAGQRLQAIEMDGNEFEADAPVTARVRVEVGDGRRVELRLPEATGVLSLLEGKADSLLDWSLYEEVLRRCRRVAVESRL